MTNANLRRSLGSSRPLDVLVNQRMLLVFAMMVYLAWWFVVRAFLPDAFNPLASRLVVCGTFLFVLAASYASSFVRRYIEQAYLFCAVVLTGHYFYLYLNNRNDLNWITGTYITIIAVGSTITCRKCLLLYSVLTAGACCYVVWVGHADAVSIGGLFTFLVLINLINGLRHRVDTERRLRLEGDAKQLAVETVNNAKMLFLANINHELRTPLTAITGFNQILRMGDPEKEEIELCTRRIQTNCELLLGMVEKMMHLTEEGTSLIGRKSERINLKTFFEEMIRSEQERITVKGLESSLTFLTDVPHEVVSDKAQLACAVLNVLNNATKFTPSGEIAMTVSCIPLPTGDLFALEILVKDTGVGIAADQIQNIFTTFNQTQETYTRPFGGAGIGLAVARRIARMHGGDVNLLESVVGVGSTFKITVHVAVPE